MTHAVQNKMVFYFFTDFIGEHLAFTFKISDCNENFSVASLNFLYILFYA